LRQNWEDESTHFPGEVSIDVFLVVYLKGEAIRKAMTELVNSPAGP
jgi:hypothetical protein